MASSFRDLENPAEHNLFGLPLNFPERIENIGEPFQSSVDEEKPFQRVNNSVVGFQNIEDMEQIFQSMKINNNPFVSINDIANALERTEDTEDQYKQEVDHPFQSLRDTAIPFQIIDDTANNLEGLEIIDERFDNSIDIEKIMGQLKAMRESADLAKFANLQLQKSTNNAVEEDSILEIEDLVYNVNQGDLVLNSVNGGDSGVNQGDLLFDADDFLTARLFFYLRIKKDQLPKRVQQQIIELLKSRNILV